MKNKPTNYFVSINYNLGASISAFIPYYKKVENDEDYQGVIKKLKKNIKNFDENNYSVASFNEV